MMRDVNEVDDETMIRHMNSRPWAAITEDVRLSGGDEAVRRWGAFHIALRRGALWALQRKLPMFMIDELSGRADQHPVTPIQYFRWRYEHPDETALLDTEVAHDFHTADQMMLRTELLYPGTIPNLTTFASFDRLFVAVNYPLMAALLVRQMRTIGEPVLWVPHATGWGPEGPTT